MNVLLMHALLLHRPWTGARRALLGSVQASQHGLANRARCTLSGCACCSLLLKFSRLASKYDTVIQLVVFVKYARHNIHLPDVEQGLKPDDQEIRPER